MPMICATCDEPVRLGVGNFHTGDALLEAADWLEAGA